MLIVLGLVCMLSSCFVSKAGELSPVCSRTDCSYYDICEWDDEEKRISEEWKQRKVNDEIEKIKPRTSGKKLIQLLQEKEEKEAIKKKYPLTFCIREVRKPTIEFIDRDKPIGRSFLRIINDFLNKGFSLFSANSSKEISPFPLISTCSSVNATVRQVVTMYLEIMKDEKKKENVKWWTTPVPANEPHYKSIAQLIIGIRKIKEQKFHCGSRTYGGWPELELNKEKVSGMVHCLGVVCKKKKHLPCKLQEALISEKVRLRTATDKIEQK